MRGMGMLVPIERIEETENMFKPLDEQMFKELVESIKQIGILEPLLVVEHSGNYQIKDGRQRFAAAKVLGFKMIPCLPVAGEAAVAAEFDPNILRRHLTSKEILEYFRMRQEALMGKKPVLIPELETIREVIPKGLLGEMTQTWSLEDQKRFYKALPVKCVEDTKALKDYENKVRYLTTELDNTRTEASRLKRMLQHYQEMQNEYETLKKAKKESFNQALELKKKEIEDELRNSAALSEAETARKLEERKRELEEEYKKKFEEDIEEYRKIAAAMSKERAELEKKLAPLEEAKKQLEKDKKQLEEYIKNKALEVQYVNENLKKFLEAERFPERMKNIAKDLHHVTARVVSLTDHMLRTGDVIQEQREELLKVMAELKKETAGVNDAVANMESYIR